MGNEGEMRGKIYIQKFTSLDLFQNLLAFYSKRLSLFEVLQVGRNNSQIMTQSHQDSTLLHAVQHQQFLQLICFYLDVQRNCRYYVQHLWPQRCETVNSFYQSILGFHRLNLMVSHEHSLAINVVNNVYSMQPRLLGYHIIPNKLPHNLNRAF